MNVISVKKLAKHFKVRTNKNLITGLFEPKYKIIKAVDGISFDIEKGEAVAFLGPNGAGKTTTTKMMTGLVYPTEGSVEVLGYTPFERKTDFLKRIGLVMGNKAGLNWDLTANQSFWLYRKIYKISDDEFALRIKEMTELLEVTHLLDTQVRRLSLGERMKLELIAALLHNPEVLFLDEPTIGLDIFAKKHIREFLRRVQKEFGTTLILTSHDMDDVEQVCDRVIIINKGEKIYDDSIKTLMSTYEKMRYVRFTFEKQPAEEKMSSLGDIVESNDDYYLMKVKPKEMVELISKVSKQFDLIDIQIESTPLEDMIGQIFQGENK